MSGRSSPIKADAPDEIREVVHGNGLAQVALGAAQLSALSHPTRLHVFRMLMKEAPNSMRAGVIAEQLDVAPSNLTAHLSILCNAQLLSSEADGRTRLYGVHIGAVKTLIDFLVSDCCDGHPEICAVLTRKC